ncbi:hypothetical protein Trydic_g23953 [Trypoxylus dichotomus]
MAKDRDASFNDKTLTLDDSNSNKSFVKKIKSRVSGFLPSSLTRLFGSTESQVRYREESDDEDEESFRIQPPTKRIKPNDTVNSVGFQFDSASTPKYTTIDVPPNKTHLNSVNHVENKLTFPEPIPGPSGYKPTQNLSTSGKSSLNKQLYTIENHITNGDKYSDSGESVTSEYSSMLIGGKDVVSENKRDSGNNATKDETKLIYGINSRLNDRSLFSDRCTSPKTPNVSMSSRQPSFNSSVFGSPNFVDRTLASKKILNSPFYSGRTTYGGASAYGRSLASLSSDYRSTARNTVQIKPVNDNVKYTLKTSSTLSKTARRILNTLEQYTTPISDAKKIPNPTNPNRKRSTNPYSARERVASNRELQVPTVPDLLKMKLKERLQDSTESVRQLANSSKSVLNREEYKIRTLEDDTNNSAKHTNKIKNKIYSTRQKDEPHRTAEEVKLPDVQLPITTLPSFDFSLPISKNTTATPKTNTTETAKILTTTSTTKTVEKTSNTQKTIEIDKTEVTTLKTSKRSNSNTESNTTECKKSERSRVTEFTFSDPLVIAENLKSIRAINNFIFSDPTPTSSTSNTPEVSKEKQNEQALTKPASSTPLTTTTLKNNGENPIKDRPLQPMSVIPTSTLKPFKADLLAKFKASSDTWECNVCLIRNVNSKNKCAACDAAKPQATGKNQNPAGFGDKFKKADGQWDCKVCLVVNPGDKNKCVACEAPKQDLKVNETSSKNENRAGLLGADMWECKSCFVRNKNSEQKCVACTNPKPTVNGPSLKLDSKTPQGFGLKFAPPPETWECGTCSIRNKNDNPKCLACRSRRPAHIKPSSGFGDSFKKKEDEWECDACMVRNPKDKRTCRCCDALRVGPPDPDIPKATKPISLFNYGLDPTQKLTVTGFTFGIKPPQTTTSTSSTAPSFTPIFGQAAATANTSSVVTASTTTTSTFTFGIKQTQEKNENAIPVINVEDTSSNSKNLNASKKAEENVKIISNQLLNPAESSSNKQPITFGSNESKKEENSTLNGETKISSGVFGIIANKPVESTTPSSNIFSKEANSTPAFAFGANPATAAPTSTTSSSIFGANPSQSTTSVFKFGTNEPSLLAAKPTAFGNATPQQNPAPSATFNAPATAQNLFTGPSQGTSAFGAPSTVETPSAIPAFSTDTTTRDGQPPAKVPVFSFGQTNKPETEQSKFGFGALQSSAVPAAGSFNFGQVSAQPSLNFAAGSNVAPAQSGLGFDQGAANQNGAPIFNFGAGANATPKTGFNFGAGVVPQPAAPGVPGPAAPNTGIFNFGGFQANGPPPPNPGGFNFSGSVVSDFKPNFNFTSGAPPATFSAQPNSGDKAARVMRKAVRRSHR